MTSNTPLHADRLRGVYWLAQIGSVVIMTALAWFLPELIAIDDLPQIHVPVLIAGLVAIPLILIVTRRLVPSAKPLEKRYDPLDNATPAPRSVGLGTYLIALALCEIPIVLGLVAVLMGARPEYALGLGTAALGLLWNVRAIPRAL
ncbi:hypothetical protein [Allochromatium vinosum]|uniref:Transmembrane protein n=1 Tax=Allochromatium vinosum (strain ATCC 17899 / DSM 180 / NBRC 103801 / NCIMB 10441 / D) TaxID=572477 RepID=D3RWB7_ALLVD|nr:hypothetical protein [Allochromatium vinosum]ADC64129.1 hypothetical protein Alvin_3237 [Allochromatium vinosum DSM 180]